MNNPYVKELMHNKTILLMNHGANKYLLRLSNLISSQMKVAHKPSVVSMFKEEHVQI
jgi:hypothetical protein